MFKPTLKSVTSKKMKALDVFESAKSQLSAAIAEFKAVITTANEKKSALIEKIHAHDGDIVAAQKEIAATESTISKINQIVGS